MEENYLEHMWTVLNTCPEHIETVDRNVVVEFFKLMLDPYSRLENIVPVMEELIQINSDQQDSVLEKM